MTFTFYAYEPISAYKTGQNSDYLESGLTIMGACVYIVNIRVIMLHNTVLILSIILELSDIIVH